MKEEIFEKSKETKEETKEREHAEFRIKSVISSMRKKMILIIVGSLLLTYATYEGAHGRG